MGRPWFVGEAAACGDDPPVVARPSVALIGRHGCGIRRIVAFCGSGDHAHVEWHVGLRAALVIQWRTVPAV